MLDDKNICKYSPPHVVRLGSLIVEKVRIVRMQASPDVKREDIVSMGCGVQMGLVSQYIFRCPLRL